MVAQMLGRSWACIRHSSLVLICSILCFSSSIACIATCQTRFAHCKGSDDELAEEPKEKALLTRRREVRGLLGNVRALWIDHGWRRFCADPWARFGSAVFKARTHFLHTVPVSSVLEGEDVQLKRAFPIVFIDLVNVFLPDLFGSLPTSQPGEAAFLQSQPGHTIFVTRAAESALIVLDSYTFFRAVIGRCFFGFCYQEYSSDCIYVVPCYIVVLTPHPT